MKFEMSSEQLFCIRNWAVCAGSLRIRLTAEFANGMPEEELELDLQNGSSSMDGLVTVIQPEKGGVGLLCLGLDPTSQSDPITRLRLHLENAGGTLSSLRLEYAAADPIEAYQYTAIPWQEAPLSLPDILMTPHGSSITVELTGANAEPEVPAEEPDNMAFADLFSPEEPEQWGEELLGDIAADLQLLRYYSGSEANEAARLLRSMQEQWNSYSQEEAGALLAEIETQITKLVLRTQEDVQFYRSRLLENL